MAETTITGLPNATTPLAGTERVPMDQAGATKDATTADIAALATKTTVGLGNVDNTSDANKPISTATATALAGKESSGAAAAAVAAHVAAADPHTQYAPSAQGVTNGNSHNHNGGDGAQIDYSSLSGLPTLPTGTNTGDQTLANTSDATSHTVTLSASGGSLQLVEGSNITLTTTGTGSAGVVTIASTGGGGGSGTVTSVGLVAPTGFSVSGSPVTTSGDITLAFAAGYSLPTNASQTSWDTAFTERRYWDGGATGLTASTGRTSLGLTSLATATVGSGLNLTGGALIASSAYAVNNWIVPFEGNMVAGTALTADQIALYPFTVRRNVTLNSLGARVTTVAAGSSIQLAIYGSDANNKVTGTALAATGSLSGATATTVSGSVTAFTLQAGLIYWMAINSNGVPVLLAPSALSMHLNSILGAPLLADVFGAATFSLVLRTVAQTFNTWPDLTSVTPTVVSGGTNASKGALIAMQVSALP